MARYENMISTGVSWLPRIPSHWKMQKIDALFSERKKKVSDRDFAPLSVTKNGILPQLENAAKSNDGDNRKLVKTGDFVINSRSDRKGSCGISQLDGSVSLINIVLTPRNELNGDYIHYLLRNYRFSEEYYRNGRGIVADLWTTRYSEMRMIYVPVPPRTEQDQIVRFLDWKVSAINKLIQIKNAEIQELEDLKLIKVNHFVTKGIHNALLKDSHVDWIGKIPLNWDINTIKQHFFIQKRIAGKEGFDVLSITQQGLKVKDINSNEGQMAQSYANYQFVYPGDFAMNHMDLLTGYIDLSDKFGVTSPDYRVFTLSDSENCYAPYYLRVFQIGYKRHVFYKFGKGAANLGRWRLPRRAFLDYLIPVPPLKEQVEIAEACDKVIKDIDKAINSLNSEIPRLQELKAKIISDVVTGQIDVRNVTIPEYEHIDDVATEGEEKAQDAK